MSNAEVISLLESARAAMGISERLTPPTARPEQEAQRRQINRLALVTYVIFMVGMSFVYVRAEIPTPVFLALMIVGGLALRLAFVTYGRRLLG